MPRRLRVIYRSTVCGVRRKGDTWALAPRENVKAEHMTYEAAKAVLTEAKRLHPIFGAFQIAKSDGSLLELYEWRCGEKPKMSLRLADN